MKLDHVPSLGYKYWTALILASIFGANTGDFLSDAMGLGHIAGLPFLAVLFALVIFVERFDSLKHTAYFWTAIIIIRTSATNIGDISHDLHLRAPLVILGLGIVLFVVVLIWQVYAARKKRGGSAQASSALSTIPVYWFSMLLAGALGTVLGDYFSFGLKLGTLRAALVLAVPLALAFLVFRNRLRTQLLCYFLTVVLIRAAGTAGGDFMAKRLGLPTSTLISGIVFVALLAMWRETTETYPAPGVA
jgi:uncharacterized membrane-anchored protein